MPGQAFSAPWLERFEQGRRLVIDEVLSEVSDLNEAALRWLLDPQDPSIRYQTLVDVLGHSPDSREAVEARRRIPRQSIFKQIMAARSRACLLYTSDAADDMQCVDLGGRRIIKKK